MGPYCLQYMVPRNISRQEDHTTKVVTGRHFQQFFSENQDDPLSYGPQRTKICLRCLQTTKVQTSLRIHAV